MYGHNIYYRFTYITLTYYIDDSEYNMSSDCGDLLSLSEAMLYPKQAHLFSFELFLVYICSQNNYFWMAKHFLNSFGFTLLFR